MIDTVFTKVDYDLGSLVKLIGLGEIGLPDIQRPFVWNNSKVRDLFDSMYRGYPVGYLLFWQNALTSSSKGIGNEEKQKAPRLVIVDGQQRLTSLYAVIRGIDVLRESFDYERIQIAFNPLEQRFEVADAAIKRDKSFIPDISVLWSLESDLFEVVDRYLEDLKSSREVSAEDERKIKRAISRLQGLTGFPFTALELAADIDEEAVSEVFVRINSKGTPLNQADFILTLMSVFWDEGRTALEDFCRRARIPSKGEPSPFNHYIEPSPDQLLRASVGVAFKRARLKHVYSILRGKDLQTAVFSEEHRIEQFDRLKDAQARALNLQHWYDFMNCIRQAGFRSDRMISSQNNLVFAYMLYLIGRTEYKVPEFELRRAIARWFFMSSVTGRYASSPESAMEFDLARLRDIQSPEEFLQTLGTVCDVTLTSDFWAMTLPNDLATSAARGPALFAFHAALVLLDAPTLFSKLKVADFLDPTVTANRSGIERHHLFPKAFLARQGLVSTRDTNQIANYALVEWGDNNNIADQDPSDYVPELEQRFSQAELEKMYRLHALPSNWERLEYKEFLQARRELIADVIRQGYSTLSAQADDVAGTGEAVFDLAQAVAAGESEAVEFKSTLRTNLHTGEKDPHMEFAVLRTLAGFLNNGGGTLVVGVADDGNALGVAVDGFENEDKMALHLVNLIKSRIGVTAATTIHLHFGDHDGCRVLVASCKDADAPVFVQDGNVERFFVRTGPSTTELSASQTHEYIRQRFS